jgi:hypothetical protein
MTAKPAPAAKVRGFSLQLQPAGPDEYGLVLEETNGSAATPPMLVARADPDHTRRVLPSLINAVRASGHPKTVLFTHRAKPVPLREEDGVRLALLLIASGPVSKARRIEEMAAAVSGMSTEEAYYWYARCTGPEASRIRRALRVFLAEE